MESFSMGKGGVKHSINQNELCLEPKEYRLSLLFRVVHPENVVQAQLHHQYCESESKCGCDIQTIS